MNITHWRLCFILLIKLVAFSNALMLHKHDVIKFTLYDRRSFAQTSLNLWKKYLTQKVFCSYLSCSNVFKLMTPSLINVQICNLNFFLSWPWITNVTIWVKVASVIIIGKDFAAINALIITSVQFFSFNYQRHSFCVDFIFSSAFSLVLCRDQSSRFSSIPWPLAFALIGTIALKQNSNCN